MFHRCSGTPGFQKFGKLFSLSTQYTFCFYYSRCCAIKCNFLKLSVFSDFPIFCHISENKNQYDETFYGKKDCQRVQESKGPVLTG